VESGAKFGGRRRREHEEEEVIGLKIEKYLLRPCICHLRSSLVNLTRC